MLSATISRAATKNVARKYLHDVTQLPLIGLVSLQCLNTLLLFMRVALGIDSNCTASNFATSFRQDF